MACPTGKKQYRKKLNALFALVQIQRQDDPRHQECRVYRCPICRRWHLTSMTEKEHEQLSQTHLAP